MADRASTRRRTTRILTTVALAGAGVLGNIGHFAAHASTAGPVVTGSLLNARDDAAAAELGDGEVLVAGGLDSGGSPLSSAELYQPSTGEWSSTGSLPLPLADATATVLTTGRVLVAGGWTGSAGALSASAVSELYDPTTGTWTATGSLPVGSAAASAALLSSGSVLYVGGLTGTNADTTAVSALYNPTIGTWTQVSGAALPFSTADAAVSALGDGDVLVAGGETVVAGSASLTANAALFVSANNGWTATASMPTARMFATATLLGNGDVLVAGGASTTSGSATNSAVLFDPSTGSWSSAASLPTPTYGASATLLASGEVLYAGGLTSPDTPSAAAELYDPSTQTWTETTALLTARAFASAVRLSNGNVLIAGGEVATGVTASSELYPSGAAPVITSPATLDVQAGQPTSFAISASGTPTPSLSETGSLPTGLSFHDNGNGTATISGTTSATASGSVDVTIVASNGVNSPAVQTLHILFATPARITSAATLQAAVSTATQLQVTASGTPTPSLSETGSLPAGLSFHDNGNGTATISGTPTTSGAYSLTLVASNGIGAPSSQGLTLTVLAALPSVPGGIGYWYATSSGVVYAKGDAAPIAPVHPQAARDIVAIAPTHTQRGYYLVSSFGGVYNYGDAKWYGSIASRRLPTQVVSFAVDPSGGGYYIVTRAGNVFNFGNAPWYGSTFNRGLPPIQSFALSPDGRGYYLVTTAGNIYTFGDTHFLGSPASQRIANPQVRGFAPTSDGDGYWVATESGNVLAYGDAHDVGSLENRRVPAVTAFAATLDGQGYWLITARGNIFNFGDAKWFGSSAGVSIGATVTAFAPQY